jgi:uncharacterized pyridoxal phosphate-containing UPF0001 family protein
MTKKETQMDRKLTRKEKIKAKSRHMTVPALVLIGLLTLPVFVTNHSQIFEGIGKVRAAVTQIVNVTAFVIDSIIA